jgi:transposase-like protein
MKITIDLTCPHCVGSSIVRNGKKRNGAQNYLCKICKKQFIADHERTYRGSAASIVVLIKMMLVRGGGVRDAAAALGISAWKVLKTLRTSLYTIKPKQKHYNRLELDELWTYVGKKRTDFGLYTPITVKPEKSSLMFGENGIVRPPQS